MTATTGARAVTAVEGQSRIPKPFRRLGLHFVVILLMVIWLLPTVGLLVNSFRHATDVTSSGWWVPSAYTLQNYDAILNQSSLFDAFINSLFITIPASIIPILVAAFAAYAFSWMNFPGRNWLFIFVVGLLVVPLQMTLIPILKLYAGANLNGQFLAVWLAHTGYGLPFAIYLLRNFMGSLPREIFESAYIDGASPVTAFFRLALPMSVPAIAALAIFQFLFVWNDLLVAITYIGASNSENLPLTGFVSNLVSSTGAGWELLGAAAVLAMAQPMLVVFALQRYFVRGITGGAVKG
jgi:alpha-glucoside transport system permease protein